MTFHHDDSSIPFDLANFSKNAHVKYLKHLSICVKIHERLPGKIILHIFPCIWQRKQAYLTRQTPIFFFLCTSYIAFIISKCCETEISIRSCYDYVVRVNCLYILSRVRSRALSTPIPQPHMRICISSVINTTLHVHCVFMLKGSSASWMWGSSIVRSVISDIYISQNDTDVAWVLWVLQYEKW